jgi:hypothetical protein
MRILVLASFAAVALLASTARAEDTKPPAISDVKASARGGKVSVEARITDETGVLSAIVHHRGAGGKIDDTTMQKNEYDDIFKATFPGSSETEYWIESSDLLGNGPSNYGTASKPYTASGKPGKGGASVATREAPPRREEHPPRHEEPPPAQEEPAAEPPPRHERKEHVAKASPPPVIEHRKPSAQPPEGRDFTVRMKIKSDLPVGVAILMLRPLGTSAFTSNPLTHTEGDSYEGVIPGDKAKGTIEYFIAAKNQAGQATRQGDTGGGGYTITFKPLASASASTSASTSASASAAASPAVAAAEKPAGPYQFSHLPLYRVQPGKPIVVRAQIVSSADNEPPDRTAILWRGNDGTDQFTEMTPDLTGGYGGFKAELPAQDEGGVYYQVIACDEKATICGDDTGSKRKWHSAAVSAQPGGAQPMPIDVPSSRAPPSLPE